MDNEFREPARRRYHMIILSSLRWKQCDVKAEDYSRAIGRSSAKCDY